MSKTIRVVNFKGVREIELHPAGSLIVIAGGNGAGKSSLIDAITELFDPRGTKLTPKPIREGADEARAEYVDDELGLRIRRVWKKNGTAGTLTVEALDGARYSKPADVVAQLTGGAIFDPVTWLNLPEKAQRDELLAKVDLPFDLDELARQKAGAEERRRDIGREVKRLQGALASMPAAADAPEAEVSAQALLERIQAAQELDRRRLDADRAVVAAEQQVESAEAALRRAQDALRGAVSAARAIPQQTDDVESLRAELSRVDEINQQVRANHERAKVADELEAHEAEYAAAQARLNHIEEQKREGLAAATFPVPGLSVDETGVTFEGVPFGQVNTAHRTRVAFGIATAGDPELRLVIVRNGDLLDSGSLAALADMAEERGYTVLVERDRDESRSIGFTVRDGALAEEVA
ncbi:ATP-binding protein [Microbacterium sp. gxy059]|uniref:ATP-binding protein n=1 Tax=Microbacterium sp. gxy059 TaxID=2957199 RepID=UPI003D97FB41